MCRRLAKRDDGLHDATHPARGSNAQKIKQVDENFSFVFTDAALRLRAM